MSAVVIRVKDLGKCYRLHQAGGPRAGGYRRLSEVMRDRVRSWWRGRGARQAAGEDFWALRDVSVEIRRGETVGVMGRNGAGKSTLLKLLSRITEPSRGRIDLTGRVASLLEVGTGFHPELTGRENIFVNGAILGMTRAEIRRKFDEIVAFADVDKFLDTPVKRYSSGMGVRLAFAVAAHLDPDILVVDEVLAVGDALFQRKCLGKMQDVSTKEGRTVLFVSHNLHAVRALCSRGLLLVDGRLVADGPINRVTVEYSESLKRQGIDATTGVHNYQVRRGSGAARFVGVQIQDQQGEERLDFAPSECIRFRCDVEVFQPVPNLAMSINLRGGAGNEVVTTQWVTLSETPLTPPYRREILIEFPRPALRPGEYPLYIWLGDLDRRPFDVLDGLTIPLVINTTGDRATLGYDPAVPSGYFSLESRVVSSRPIASA